MIQEMCIEHAKKILKKAAPTLEEVEAVERLMSMAMNIEELNLRRQSQTRYAAAGARGSVCPARAKEN